MVKKSDKAPENAHDEGIEGRMLTFALVRNVLRVCIDRKLHSHAYYLVYYNTWYIFFFILVESSARRILTRVILPRRRGDFSTALDRTIQMPASAARQRRVRPFAARDDKQRQQQHKLRTRGCRENEPGVTEFISQLFPHPPTPGTRMTWTNLPAYCTVQG